MLKHYTHFITKHFKAVLLTVTILTGIFGYYAQNLSIDASAETLLLENDQDLKLTREVHARYISPDYLVISFSPKEYLLSDATLSTIRNLKASLLKIEGVESVTSLLDVPLLQSPPRPIQEIIGNVQTLESPGIDKALVQKELTSSPLYAQNLVSEDFKTTAIVVNLKDDLTYTELLTNRNKYLLLEQERALTQDEKTQYDAAKKAFKVYRDSTRDETHRLIETVRATLKPYKGEGDLFLGGVIMIADDMISFVKDDIKIYGIAILVIMIAILWIIFRQIRFVVLPIIVSISAVVITTGINALLGLEVTVISSNYVAMQLITTLSLVIHLIVCYREEYALYPDASQKELLGIVFERMSIPSIFVILTSIAGFGSLMTCGILPIIDLGTMMNIGVSISLIVTYTLFPAMMMLFKKEPPVLVFDKAFTLNETFAKIVEHHSRIIVTVVIALGLFSIVGASRLVVENSFINYFKKSTEIYKGMKKIDNNLGGTTPLEIVVKFPKAPAQKANNEDAASAIDGFEEEFNAMNNDAQYWFTAQKMQTILNVHDYLLSLPEIGNVSSLGTLSKVGRILKNGNDFDNFELALLYNELPERYKKILLSPYINIEHDEARFVVRVVDSNPELRRSELLENIQKGLQSEVGLDPQNYHLVGMMVLYNNMLQSLFSSQISTLGLAVLSLGAMFLFLFRSLKIALLAMTVNMVPVSVIFGIMGFANIPLDMMSITIASIALGITVDNTIHYYYRFREELQIDGDYIASMHRAHGTIAFGMFYYSLATIVGFLVMVTSNFIPTLIFGLLTVIVLITAIVSDLLFSPFLVVFFKPFGKGATHKK
ncbi:efflux RND transporter permease subunit [Sulfurospirillum halorespirans]|uniref:Putative RND lipid exporter n=1 Tax=Sulfurospirillum halorespirans DSM 13726 TaxID=1193502 RepID=A0A1D7TLR8_9BACT|nr:MMPL family transporter [Sulfurospirillum halorespirans]AOO65945.1 putative RND lipid exporter [Sulfurospirillum halorespirans DSM 13726]